VSVHPSIHLSQQQLAHARALTVTEGSRYHTRGVREADARYFDVSRIGQGRALKNRRRFFRIEDGRRVNVIVAGYQSRVDLSFSGAFDALVSPTRRNFLWYYLTPTISSAEIGQAFLSSSPFDSLPAAHLPLSSANSPASGASVHVDFYLTVCPESKKGISPMARGVFISVLAARTSPPRVRPSV